MSNEEIAYEQLKQLFDDFLVSRNIIAAPHHRLMEYLEVSKDEKILNQLKEIHLVRDQGGLFSKIKQRKLGASLYDYLNEKHEYYPTLLFNY